MKIKRFVCILTVLCLALNAFAMKYNYADGGDTWFLSDCGSYTKLVSMWKNETAAENAGFEDTLSAGVTPGKANSLFGSSAGSFPQSALDDVTALGYYYEGKNYAYGIDRLGNETIAFRQANGEKLDAVDGAGKLRLLSTGGKNEATAETVLSFEESADEKGNTRLQVTYTVSGAAAESSEISAVYTFFENCIAVTLCAAVSAPDMISKDKSYISRSYPNGYEKDRVQVNEQWIYPDNLDYPYPEFESLVYIDYIDSLHKMYTAVRGENVPTEQHMVEDRLGTRLPLYFNNSQSLEYTHSYYISFVDMTSETQSPDYLGLFKGKNSDFAAGIAAIDDSGDSSTVFEGDSVSLNLNVTNLLGRELTFSLRYDIRDSYGNITDAGLFTDNKISAFLDANRTVTVSGQYGMYYLNLYVISENSSYKECFPFALVEDYDYRYSASSPFGIASAAAGKKDSPMILERYADTARLMKKIGVVTVRAGNEPGSFKMMDTLIGMGINRINGGFGPNNDSAENIDSYVSSFMTTADALAGYVDSLECGNEMSLLSLKAGGPAVDELFPKFYYYTFLPTYNALKAKYPNLTYIPTPCSACETSWLERFLGFDEDIDGDGVNTHVNSFWQDIKVLTTHIYGNPYMPDTYAMAKPEYGGELWNIECGMQRMKKFLSENPDEQTQTEKDFYLTEVGYPTAPGDPRSVDIRTQADYIVRIGAICSAYGADRIQYYQMYDRTSYNSGYNSSNGEYNFGLFYKQDFYNVVKPKPAGAAFAVMTRRLESMVKNSGRINEKYDEGYNNGGVRAFTFDTELFGSVTVAYSNAQVLSNARKNSIGRTGLRTPSLPWNSQWTETDTAVFETESEQVEVYDIMGNKKIYTAQNGRVTVGLTGSPVYIIGIE